MVLFVFVFVVKRFELSNQILGLTGFKCKTILSHLTYKFYNNNIKGIWKQPIFTTFIEPLTLGYEQQLGQLLKFENLAHNLAMLVIVAFHSKQQLHDWNQDPLEIGWLLKQNKSLEESWVCMEASLVTNSHALNHSCCPLLFLLV
jgi:hypothetical protein